MRNTRSHGPPEQPTLVIDDLVLAKLAAHHARSIDGVARLQPDLTHSVTAALRSAIGVAHANDQATDGVTVDSTDSAPLIKIRFVAYHDHSALAVAEAVQRGVLAAINQYTGITPTVSILVTDVEPQS